MAYKPIPVRRAERTLGANLRTQRKLLGLTAQVVAERAGISTTTLRRIEHGGGAGSDALLRVLRILGLLEAVVTATDPLLHGNGPAARR